METPQNNIWGPELWKIFHYAAERVGSQNLKRLPHEEARIWSGLLSSLRFTLPCPLCKKHYTQFFSSHPLATINRDTVRKWLFDLHQSANQHTGKQVEITLEELPSIYGKPFHFSKHLHPVETHMSYALRMGWITRNDLIRTLRFFEELKRFYDFF